MQAFDNDIALIFDMPTLDAKNLPLNFVDALKDILKLDYGHLHTPITIFKCKWIKQEGNTRNPTYVQDDVGFFMINLCHYHPSFSYFLVKQHKCFFQMTSRSQVGKLCCGKKFIPRGRWQT